ncbi:hypothetical protein [Conexibacter arvalis]|uniref:Uncharacterized protein n=1 Tax=Conexibacter arvalis TaxID=912552 RepID=A0A840IJD2_9ACTN|nr:hypothetical protein [Conexibacter arvalis]MBB4664866.1 hypothetical protein [Conexibacter arvalis]
MLYDDDTHIEPARSGDTPPDPQELLADLTALLDAGLIVPVRDRDGEVRVTPAEPLEWEEHSRS